MDMAKIVIPEYSPDEFQEQLVVGYEVVYDPDLYADRPRLLAEIADAVAIVIRNRTQVNPEFLSAATPAWWERGPDRATPWVRRSWERRSA